MKKLLLIISSLLFISALSAEDNKKKSLNFYYSLDAAYYMKYSRETGGDHFATLSGPFSGAEGLLKIGFEKTINTPLGDHWLVNSAFCKINCFSEITPVHIKPGVDFTFQPLPFISFSTGASTGLGWIAMGLNGMSVYNTDKKEYSYANSFEHVYYKFYATGTFMFDTGAIIQRDWSHVVMLANYTVFYEGLSGMGKGDLWEWLLIKHKANGFQYETKIILGYQMPLKLKLAGIITELSGHFNGSDYGDFDENFDGSFMTVKFSPFVQIEFSKKTMLSALIDISSTRSFEQEYDEQDEVPFLTTSGREWFCNRIAFSIKHYF